MYFPKQSAILLHNQVLPLPSVLTKMLHKSKITNNKENWLLGEVLKLASLFKGQLIPNSTVKQVN